MFIATGLGTQPAHADPCNILLLIADDFGADVAKFFPTSARKETTPPAPLMPNLQALARKGVMFTRAWADPWCSPTRATILTGRYGFRTGIGRPNVPGLPDLGLGEVTLPEVFRAAASADYVLANLGKWHLSSAADDPNRQGWTRYAGGHPDLGKLPSYYDWPKTVDGVTTASTTYATTETVDEALAVIDQAEREDRPYFLWVGFNAPHDPYERPPDQLISRHDLPATGAPARTYFDSMVEAMDTEIGRLLGAVNLANTTVIFLGDNGTAPAVTAPPYSATKAKGTMYQGGVHVPLFISGAGVMRWGRQEIALVNTTDLFPAILQLAGINLAHPALAGVKRTVSA